MKFMVRSSPLGIKRLTVTGFGIEMASAAPSSAIDGGAQRNENKSKEQSWRMVTLMNDLRCRNEAAEVVFPPRS
jgi:hypothetical protein